MKRPTTQVGITTGISCEVFEHGTNKSLGVFDSYKSVATAFLKNPQKANNISRAIPKGSKVKAKAGTGEKYGIAGAFCILIKQG